MRRAPSVGFTSRKSGAPSSLPSEAEAGPQKRPFQSGQSNGWTPLPLTLLGAHMGVCIHACGTCFGHVSGNLWIRYSAAREWEVILPEEREDPWRNSDSVRWRQPTPSLLNMWPGSAPRPGQTAFPVGESPVCSRGGRVSFFGRSEGDRRCSGRENS